MVLGRRPDGACRPDMGLFMTVQISRRAAIGLALTTALEGLVPIRANAQNAGSRPLIGAIRWDAWYAPGSGPTEAVRRSLSPEQYHWRAPFFASQCRESEICLPPGNQALLDLEIEQAAAAGLDYWAFVAYGAASDLTRALDLYLRSGKRQLIRFAMFSELSKLGTSTAPSSMLAEHIALMGHPSYLRVLGGRPVYFIGFINQKLITDNWGDSAGLKRQIRELKRSAQAKGSGDPYVVIASVQPEMQGVDLGADAVGSYAISSNAPAAPFWELAKVAEKTWAGLSSFGLPVVPTVMAGWDRRPRIDHPVPWELKTPADADGRFYYARPTAAEFATHLEAASRFIKGQPQRRQSPIMLIYAWNENDEGGWLIPDMNCNAPLLTGLQLYRELPSRGFRCR